MRRRKLIPKWRELSLHRRKADKHLFSAVDDIPRRIFLNGHEVTSDTVSFSGSKHPGVKRWGLVEVVQGPALTEVEIVDGKMRLNNGRLRFAFKRGFVTWEHRV
jgi:hypothetical protein